MFNEVIYLCVCHYNINSEASDELKTFMTVGNGVFSHTYGGGFRGDEGLGVVYHTVLFICLFI